MIDHRERQREEVRRDRRVLLVENVSREKAAEMAKNKQIPVGSCHKWALDAVYGPIGSADKENKNASAA